MRFQKYFKKVPYLCIKLYVNFFQIPPSMLETMLHHLEVGYMSNANPYHNNLHACDVLQTTHYFISQTGLSVNKTIVYFLKRINFLRFSRTNCVLISYLSLNIELDVRFRNLYLIDCGHYSRF